MLDTLILSPVVVGVNCSAVLLLAQFAHVFHWRFASDIMELEGERIMRDFLRGTMGCALQVVLFVAAVSLIGLAADHNFDAVGKLFPVLGILCFCAIAGIRYALGNIFRIR